MDTPLSNLFNPSPKPLSRVGSSSSSSSSTYSPQALLNRYQKLREQRRDWEDLWREIAEVMQPWRSHFTESGQNAEYRRRRGRQFDGTPLQAARYLAAALDDLLKPRAQPWFNLQLEDPELAKNQDVRIWIEETEQRLHRALYNPKARFTQRSGAVDLDLVLYGTGVLYIGLNRDLNGLLFRSIDLASAYLAENADGTIDTVFVNLELPARSAAERFGHLSPSASQIAERDPDRKLRFIHAVFPRDVCSTLPVEQRLSNQMPFASVILEEEGGYCVSEGGFIEFPYAIPRWDTLPGEVHGRSPGMIALADAASLHEIGRTLLKAGQKAVDPPLLVADQAAISVPSLVPGGVTYYDQTRSPSGRPAVEPLSTGANLPLGREIQNDARGIVWNAFFRDFLDLPQGGPHRTATEILERRERFMRALGPTLGRLEADYLAPVLARAYGLLMRKRALPPPPDKLKGVNWRFDIISPIDRARKRANMQAFAQLAGLVRPLTDNDPSLIEHFDGPRIITDLMDAAGLPKAWLKSQEQIDTERQAEAEAMAEDDDFIDNDDGEEEDLVPPAGFSAASSPAMDLESLKHLIKAGASPPSGLFPAEASTEGASTEGGNPTGKSSTKGKGRARALSARKAAGRPLASSITGSGPLAGISIDGDIADFISNLNNEEI